MIKKIRDTISFNDRFSGKNDKKGCSLSPSHAQSLLNHIEDMSGEQILDISCGTVLFAEQLLNPFSGIDLVRNVH